MAPSVLQRRGDPDDPRLGDVVQLWDSGQPAFRHGQPVLIGFPCDEGVRRNGGRPGAAAAPDSIRQSLYRLTSHDVVAGVDLSERALFDVGNVRAVAGLEQAQRCLGNVIGSILKAGGVPIVLGGGHETAFGHFLGHVEAGMNTAIVNVDAHLDVRSYATGGHSGSPFRQAMEHSERPLRSGNYAVIGAQRQSVAAAHAEYVTRNHGRVHWLPDLVDGQWPLSILSAELERMASQSDAALLTVDADAFRQADVPATSAPSPAGLHGAAWHALAMLAGSHPKVRSIDLVEVNPAYDRDGQTSRWAAFGIRQFLVGLAKRS